MFHTKLVSQKKTCFSKHFNNLNCEKTQQLKLGQNSKNQIVTKNQIASELIKSNSNTTQVAKKKSNRENIQQLKLL